MGFDEMGQLLTVYFGFFRHLRVWGEREYNEAVHRVQGSL